jgi:predicted nuclease of predicted toxin-antitoxin system
VNFLVDNQLPTALARFLSAAGHPAQHVLDVTLNEADDRPIWDYAKTHGLIVISKDEDFVHLAQRPGETGRLLWVRMGNCRNDSLLAAFESALPKIEQSFMAGQHLVELR